MFAHACRGHELSSAGPPAVPSDGVRVGLAQLLGQLPVGNRDVPLVALVALEVHDERGLLWGPTEAGREGDEAAQRGRRTT